MAAGSRSAASSDDLLPSFRFRESGGGRSIWTIYYFYNNPCETCHEVENFSADLRESFGSAGAPFHYNVIGFYIYGNEGSEKIKEVKKHFGISDQEISYPLVVAGENYLCGETKVKNGVRQMMEKAWEEQKQEAANTSAKLPGMKKAVSGGIIVILLIFALGTGCENTKRGKCRMRNYFLREETPAKEFCDAYYLGNGHLGTYGLWWSAPGDAEHQRGHTLVRKRDVSSESAAL